MIDIEPLTEKELLKLTKVSIRAKNRHQRISTVLTRAGIHHWWDFDEKRVITTKHHVVCARPISEAPANDTNKPNMMLVK